MAKAFTFGNGHMLVALNYCGNVSDLYYPYVGLENHISGASGSYAHRIGVWAEGELSWVDDGSWQITLSSLPRTAAGIIHATHERMGITLEIHNTLYNEKNIFLRRIRVTNSRDMPRDIKLYFSQQFRIAEDSRGATGFYDPRVHAIIHYKHQYTFLVNARMGKVSFDDFSIGLFDIEGKEGTHHDAKDGMLTKNPIEHGSVDSILGVTVPAKPNDATYVDFWLVAGSSVPEVHALNEYVLERSPVHLQKSTKDYWRAWSEKANCDLSPFAQHLQNLFHESLLIIRAHVDNNGGIIASSDSGMLNYGRDTYSYVWPRDAALSAYALDRAGYNYITRAFYTFCERTLQPDGYLMHKYCADGSLGSSWHPWVRDGNMQLPIQIDETALVLYGLGMHYHYAHDLEFIELIYNSLIKRAADFLCMHVDTRTHLPKDSYDLWEERYGSTTYAAAATYGALTKAAQFAAMLGKQEHSETYTAQARAMKEAIIEHLYDKELGMFVKSLRHTTSAESIDRTLDMSSFHGIVFFGVLPYDDERVVTSYETVRDRLKVPTDVGGYMRYEGDQYHRISQSAPPNPWIITTLWMAQYEMLKAQTLAELEKTQVWLEWVCVHAYNTGILSEQLNAYSGKHVSATPLTWSHGEYVHTIHTYTERLSELEAQKNT